MHAYIAVARFGLSTRRILYHIASYNANSYWWKSLTSLMNDWQFIKILPTILSLSQCFSYVIYN